MTLFLGNTQKCSNFAKVKKLERESIIVLGRGSGQKQSNTLGTAARDQKDTTTSKLNQKKDCKFSCKKLIS